VWYFVDPPSVSRIIWMTPYLVLSEKWNKAREVLIPSTSKLKQKYFQEKHFSNEKNGQTYFVFFFLLIGSSRPQGHPDSEIYLRGTSHELPISSPMKMMCYDKKKTWSAPKVLNMQKGT